MGKLMFIMFQAALINNFILSRFLGVSTFVGMTGQLQLALGMGLTVSFVMVVVSTISWLVNTMILIPLGATYLQLIIFMTILISMAQYLEGVITRSKSRFFVLMAPYTKLTMVNSAVLGVMVLNVQNELNLIESMLYSVGGGLGFTLALVLMSGIHERLDAADIPRAFKGTPIILVTGAILSLAFTVFTAFSFY